MANRKKRPQRSPYAVTEADLLHFAQWAALVSWCFLVIAAILTESPKLMMYSVIIGLFIAYAVYKKWFSI